jgi:predicted RNA-binding Zn-ribbon protein involved in translation (DUF1610 family)
MKKRVSQIVCENCGKTVYAVKGIKGRIILTSGLGVGLGIVGASIGASIGIATGGSAIAATIPLATAGLLIGGGTGYITGDKMVDKPKCPKCGKEIILN